MMDSTEMNEATMALSAIITKDEVDEDVIPVAPSIDTRALNADELVNRLDGIHYYCRYNKWVKRHLWVGARGFDLKGVICFDRASMSIVPPFSRDGAHGALQHIMYPRNRWTPSFSRKRTICSLVPR